MPDVQRSTFFSLSSGIVLDTCEFQTCFQAFFEVLMLVPIQVSYLVCKKPRACAVVLRVHPTPLNTPSSLLIMWNSGDNFIACEVYSRTRLHSAFSSPAIEPPKQINNLRFYQISFANSSIALS